MEELPQLLEKLPLGMQLTTWFIRDEAPAHFTDNIKQFLDSHYEE
jgi:hypothetical protein